MKENKSETVILYIKEKINKGIWQPGSRIHSEHLLSEELNVSRTTVRDALSKLCQDGLIIKVQGSGNYVAETATSNSEKYIIIATKTEILSDIAGYTYRILIELLTGLIIDSGFKPFVFIEQNDNIKDLIDNVNIDAQDIAGVFEVFGNNDILEGVIKNEIPIVSCLGFISNNFTSVNTDYLNLINKFKELIEKYSLKNNLIISPDFVNTETRDVASMISYIMPKYICNYNENNILSIPWQNFKDSAKLFKKKIQTLDYTPDAIIFTDDCVFAATCKVFPELKKYLEKTKIITLAIEDREFLIDVDICRVEFNLKEVAQKSMILMEKLINREYIPYHHLFITPKVVNENILK